MNEVILKTMEGKIVRALQIPPFKIPPNGILWNMRAFFLNTKDSNYYEDLLYVVPT